MSGSRPCSQESIEYGPQPVVRKALLPFHHGQVERHAPKFPPFRKIFIYRQHLGVCGKQGLRYRLEVIDEREVELGVPEMDLRVDENRPLEGTEDVVPVCVSVQKGRVNRGTADCIETIPQPSDFLIGPWGAKPLLDLCYFPSSIHFGPVPQCFEVHPFTPPELIEPDRLDPVIPGLILNRASQDETDCSRRRSDVFGPGLRPDRHWLPVPSSRNGGNGTSPRI